MRIGDWIVGPNGNVLYGFTDGQIIEQFKMSLGEMKKNELTLVGLTVKGTKVWSLDQELRQMRGYIFGLIRSRWGREMLDAHKLAMAERFGLKGGPTHGQS